MLGFFKSAMHVSLGQPSSKISRDRSSSENSDIPPKYELRWLGSPINVANSEKQQHIRHTCTAVAQNFSASGVVTGDDGQSR